MPTPLPKPFDDAFLRTRTSLALQVARRDVVHVMETLRGDASSLYGVAELAGVSQRLTILDKRLKIMAIIALRILYTTPWPQISAYLGVGADVALALYGDAVQRWIDGDPAPWAPVVEGAVVSGTYPIIITPGDVHALAAELSMSKYMDR